MSAAGTAIEPDALARDTAALVAVPSVTGSELAVLERLGELPARLGLDAELREHDLAALRAHPDHPGEEGPWWRRCTRWQPPAGATAARSCSTRWPPRRRRTRDLRRAGA